ncbi:MAG TPA: hypothetical protein VN317_01895 [Candidatus Methanoperedens sp.]|nr:hypothetical protein [Candidatus Methanoperedens sp.]
MHCGKRNLRIGPIAASLCLVLVAASAPRASAEEKLVAPAHPGAVRASPAKVGGTEGVVFFVKDPHEKVQAFYVPKYARLPKEGEGRVRGAAEIPLIAQEVGAVTSIITSMKGDYTLARASEIIVEWKPEIFAGTGIAMMLFSELQNQAKKHPGHDAELAALRAKYGWLDLAFFHPEKKAEEIFRRCSAQSSGVNPDVDQAALMQQMAKLAQEGKYEEMAELQKKLVGDDPKAEERKRKADNFGLWKGCLEEAAGYGYLTKITIDRDPHQWDVKWK